MTQAPGTLFRLKTSEMCIINKLRFELKVKIKIFLTRTCNAPVTYKRPWIAGIQPCINLSIIPVVPGNCEAFDSRF